MGSRSSDRESFATARFTAARLTAARLASARLATAWLATAWLATARRSDRPWFADGDFGRSGAGSAQLDQSTFRRSHDRWTRWSHGQQVMRHLMAAILAAVGSPPPGSPPPSPAADAPALLHAAGPSEVDSLQYRRRDYPLNCRGGGGLAFDTLGTPSGIDGTMALSLRFAASSLASGPEGQGLRPGTCAWVDRPVSDAEPRQVWFTTSIGDSILQRTVHDSSQYWGFLAFNSDSGHLSGVGHRQWDAASPPMPVRPTPAPLPPGRGLLFVRQHLLQVVLALVIVWVAIAWGPIMVLVGLWSGWWRLARLYPSHGVGPGASFRTGILIMGRTNYRGGARLTADSSYLRFSMSAMLRAGHPPFSVPWSDVILVRDEWPWFPFKGKPVARIILARHPGLRILVPPATGERIVAASEGRLHLDEPCERAVATT